MCFPSSVSSSLLQGVAFVGILVLYHQTRQRKRKSTISTLHKCRLSNGGFIFYPREVVKTPLLCVHDLSFFHISSCAWSVDSIYPFSKSYYQFPLRNIRGEIGFSFLSFLTTSIDPLCCCFLLTELFLFGWGCSC